MLKAQYDKEILQTQIEVQQQTLQNIERELQDNIGQLLSVAKINLSVLRDSQPDEDGHIQQAENIITKSIHEIRVLAKNLHTGLVQDVGLEALQLLTPDRHGRVLDATVKAAGGCFGVCISQLGTFILKSKFNRFI